MMRKLTILGLWLALALAAAGAAKPGVEGRRGLLVFRDGNRITGELVDEGAGRLVFRSDRFGEMNVARTEAHFEAMDPAAAIPVAGAAAMHRPEPERAAAETPRPAPAAAGPVAAADQPPNRPSPVLIAWMKTWKVRINAYYDRNYSDGVSRRELFGGIRSERVFGHDRLSFDVRAEQVRKNDVMDKRRLTAQADWRHDLGSRWFTLYRPFYETARTTFPLFGLQDYWLTQQQAGPIFRWISRPKLEGAIGPTINYYRLDVPRANYGVNEWFFSVWTDNQLELPWHLRLKHRGQFYVYQGDDFGWESEADLIRRLGRHFSVTLRHEYRINYPGLRATDLRRLRLLFGVEF